MEKFENPYFTDHCRRAWKVGYDMGYADARRTMREPRNPDMGESAESVPDMSDKWFCPYCNDWHWGSRQPMTDTEAMRARARELMAEAANSTEGQIEEMLVAFGTAAHEAGVLEERKRAVMIRPNRREK